MPYKNKQWNLVGDAQASPPVIAIDRKEQAEREELKQYKAAMAACARAKREHRRASKLGDAEETQRTRAAWKSAAVAVVARQRPPPPAVAEEQQQQEKANAKIIADNAWKALSGAQRAALKLKRQKRK